ncbi:MAG: hypothetical protein DIU79_16705 [Actinobacteria bacterium]|nr:MAG: hypothetical protein DIU79_16705 [Actinomycetota bacterium]
MADQLVLDIPGVTATWDRLRPGERIRYDGQTWDVEEAPRPSTWATPGHPAHCAGCQARSWRMDDAPDCDRRTPEPHVSVLLRRVGEYQWLLTHQPADQPVEVVHRG